MAVVGALVLMVSAGYFHSCQQRVALLLADNAAS
jgi:hypothetical protein